MAKGLTKYKAYPYTEFDPIMDVIIFVQDAKGIKTSQMVKDGAASASTIANWRKKKTRRPQFTTIAASAITLGLTSLPLTAEGRAKLKRK